MIGVLYTRLIRYTKPSDLLQGIFIGVGVSLSLSASESFFLRAWRKRRRFTAAVLLSTIYNLLAIVGIVIISSVIFGENGSAELSFGDILRSPEAHDTIFFCLLMSFSFSFLLQVKELIGGRIFLSFFTGKYHKPIEEDRIFMFLDLKSSTAVAEKIGHINFHKFINDFLFTISEAIISNRGEIYKYVGDEIIITWKMKEGLKDLHCIRLFFEALDRVRQDRNLFEKKYGAVPDFKAGMHCGKVVAGEMGDTKKEIAFLGDVINTTARIENECNPHQRPLLISGDLLQKISLGKEYKYEKIGDINLRGKLEKIELYAIARNPNGGLPAEAIHSSGVTLAPNP
jgi:adenylate cyclase